MAGAAKNRYQNTTLRLPKHLYARAKSAVSRTTDSSFNEFVVEAVEEKLNRLTEAEIDAAFAQMAEDKDYEQSSLQMAREFELSDWEALKITDAGPTPMVQVVDVPEGRKTLFHRTEASRNVRSSKARSR